MEVNNINIIFEKFIQITLIDLYYIKLRKFLKTCFLIKRINSCHISNLLIIIIVFIASINLKFQTFTFINNKKIHDQIAISYLDYQKTINFIIYNHYWPRLKKIIKYYI